jgi:hypothetical protein
LAPRENGPTVDEHGQLSEAAPADLRGHLERRLELVAEAYRLAPQIHSEGAALDHNVRHARVVDHIAGEGKRLDDSATPLYTPRHAGLQEAAGTLDGVERLLAQHLTTSALRTASNAAFTPRRRRP